MRHIKATVGCRNTPKTRRSLQKHNLATTLSLYNRASSQRAVRTASHSRQTDTSCGVEKPSSSAGVAAAPVLRSVCVLSASESSTVSKKQRSHSNTRYPQPRRHPAHSGSAPVGSCAGISPQFPVFSLSGSELVWSLLVSGDDSTRRLQGIHADEPA